MARNASVHMEPREIARLLQTRIWTVYRCLRSGKIAARLVGGRRYLIRRKDVMAFAEGVPTAPTHIHHVPETRNPKPSPDPEGKPMAIYPSRMYSLAEAAEALPRLQNNTRITRKRLEALRVNGHLACTASPDEPGEYLVTGAELLRLPLAEPRKPRLRVARAEPVPVPEPKKSETPAPEPEPKRESIHMEPREAARFLQTHVSTVYRFILHGKIPARRIGGRRYFIRREDVMAFAEGVPVVPVLRVEWPPRENA